jgi:hypothetical protein
MVAAALAVGCKPSAEPAGGADLRFVLEDGGRQQSLELRKRDGGGFDATIAVTGACSRSEAGYAEELKAEGDVEVEADPDGEGHPTDSFVLKGRGECRVNIRLAAPERDFAWLREADCENSCPLASKAMIRK